jgi:Pyridoxamine 5'-phosphate oxidase
VTSALPNAVARVGAKGHHQVITGPFCGTTPEGHHEGGGMAAKEPVAAQPFTAEEQRPLPPWPEARRRLAEADTYWLATVRPDGRPHVVPVLAVWLDGTLHFSAGAFWADGAPTAGPPPYDVYEVTPMTVFGFGTDETFGATPWGF